MRRVAVLIDGGFLLKRLPHFVGASKIRDPQSVALTIENIVSDHLENINKEQMVKNHMSLLYRTYYYDARPYANSAHRPISRKPIDYSGTDEFKFRTQLFECLRKSPNIALRLGEVRKPHDRSWLLKAKVQNDLLSCKRDVKSLSDDDFVPALHQKGVDMRIGIDMASLALKRLVDTIVLITGDSDFVPAAKLARREGVRVILDSLGRNVDGNLYENIDVGWSMAPRTG